MDMMAVAGVKIRFTHGDATCMKDAYYSVEVRVLVLWLIYLFFFITAAVSRTS